MVQLHWVALIMIIKREQFTRYDAEMYPECNNAVFLEYEKIATGLSDEVCSYGYKGIDDNGTFKWLPKIGGLFFRESEDPDLEKRLKAIEELQKQAQELGMGYD